MSGGGPHGDVGDDEDAPDSTADADSGITPDPFLQAIARIPERAPPPPEARVPRPGDAIGRFVVREEIGRGGMGVVYAALDPTLGREVALKVLLGAGEERRHRFLREARAAAALRHPGIVGIYEVGEDAGRAFIAMERVHGTSLRARLEALDGALPSDEARRVARELARALAKAHERGLVHRDLKPENVMLGDDGRVVLLDFGLVKIAEPEAPRAPSAMTTAKGAILGTPGYMSPEQAKGQPVDARSDVFSFGILLYEVLTGQRPFTGRSPIELSLAVERDEPAKPSSLDARVDRQLEEIVLRCLRKAKAERYADAGEILAALEAVEETDATPPRRRARGGAARRGSRILTVSTLLLTGAALASVVVLVLFARAPVELEGRAPQPPTAPTSIPATDLPVPASKSAEAIAAYRAGLRAFRAGEPWSHSFERALELDPGLAAAHLQVAATGMVQHLDNAREHLREVRAHRDTLSPRDQALADALEPLLLRQPADWAETNRRLRGAIDRFPGDAQLWFFYAAARANYDDFAAGAAALEHALELDPGFSQALASLAHIEAYRGRFAEARRAVDRCLEATPGASRCLSTLTWLRAREGDCEGMAATARQMIASGGTPLVGYLVLAEALASRGQPVATVREALRQAERGLDALPKASTSPIRWRTFARQDIRADVLAGDFDAALAKARSLEAQVAHSPYQMDHGDAARTIAELLLETGRAAEAGKVAMDFLDRRDAWEPAPESEDVAMAYDATPSLLRAARSAGALGKAEVAERRDAWLAAWSARATPVAKSYLWLHGWAGTTLGPDDAKEALAARASFGPLPPYRPETMIDAAAGMTFLLGGELDEATRWLEGATRTCSALSFPLEQTRAHLWLGRAREAARDRAGACAAYRRVIDRWGRAKPRSVTAEEARSRAVKLGCDH
ncbi:serine/threonine-protein kinase [Polyangium aurulentum]|uniref:serine/threonine-protein kinase n=1 Tax=Polyangium aurulentum TaxID=2567896 RepID=UPI00146E922A|nr:serine/threonine-protein kinase [Polyangium aurulentum]UQA62931.1 protein kinase [Polyangium aurulentum]